MHREKTVCKKQTSKGQLKQGMTNECRKTFLSVYRNGKNGFCYKSELRWFYKSTKGNEF